MRSFTSSIFFYLLGGILISMLVAYGYISMSSKNVNLMSKTITEEYEENMVPIVEVKNPLYTTAAGTIDVDIINVGPSSIKFTNNWIMEIKDMSGQMRCRAMLSGTTSNNDTALVTFTPDLAGPDQNVLPAGESRQATILVTPKCQEVLNRMAAARERAMFILVVPPTSASDFMEYFVT